MEERERKEESEGEGKRTDLRSVGARPSVGHREQSRSSVLDYELRSATRRKEGSASSRPKAGRDSERGRWAQETTHVLVRKLSVARIDTLPSRSVVSLVVTSLQKESVEGGKGELEEMEIDSDSERAEGREDGPEA